MDDAPVSKPPCTWSISRVPAACQPVLLVSGHPFRVAARFLSILLIHDGRPRMNPKHFHTPVSTRLRCPVCHQPVYSRGGIHPQCAMRQSEPALHEPEEPVEVDCRGRAGRAVAVAATGPEDRRHAKSHGPRPQPSVPRRPAREHGGNAAPDFQPLGSLISLL